MLTIIKKKLLVDVLDFAKTVTDITQEDIDIVIHSRISVLVDVESVWMKKYSPEFDVTMGSLINGMHITNIMKSSDVFPFLLIEYQIKGRVEPASDYNHTKELVSKR